MIVSENSSNYIPYRRAVCDRNNIVLGGLQQTGGGQAQLKYLCGSSIDCCDENNIQHFQKKQSLWKSNVNWQITTDNPQT